MTGSPPQRRKLARGDEYLVYLRTEDRRGSRCGTGLFRVIGSDVHFHHLLGDRLGQSCNQQRKNMSMNAKADFEFGIVHV